MTRVEFAEGWLGPALARVRREVARMRPQDRPHLVRPVTPSQTDRQPRDSVAGAKGGQGAVTPS